MGDFLMAILFLLSGILGVYLTVIIGVFLYGIFEAIRDWLKR